MVERGKTVHQKTGAAFHRNAIGMLIIGLLFVFTGFVPLLTGQGYGLLFVAVVGCVFLLWSYFSYRSGKQFSTVEDRGEPIVSVNAGERQRD
jgi:hypothetical protein